jgi:hypothetical protein
MSCVRVETVEKRSSGGRMGSEGSSAAILIKACSTEMKDIEVERRSEHPEEEQDGNCSHIPQEEEEVAQVADAAEDELRVLLHQMLPKGCCCCFSLPRTTTFATKYTSTPCFGDRRESDPALRDTPDTLTLPSPLTWKAARASRGGFFDTEAENYGRKVAAECGIYEPAA